MDGRVSNNCWHSNIGHAPEFQSQCSRVMAKIEILTLISSNSTNDMEYIHVVSRVGKSDNICPFHYQTPTQFSFWYTCTTITQNVPIAKY